MSKQITIFAVGILIVIIAAVSLLYVLLKPVAEDDWIHVSHQSSYNAPAIKTKLDPINSSMSEMLEVGYKVVSTNKTSTGLSVMLEQIKTGLDTSERRHILCMLTLPNSKKGQYEATSRCWLLN